MKKLWCKIFGHRWCMKYNHIENHHLTWYTQCLTCGKVKGEKKD